MLLQGREYNAYIRSFLDCDSDDRDRENRLSRLEKKREPDIPGYRVLSTSPDVFAVTP